MKQFSGKMKMLKTERYNLQLLGKTKKIQFRLLTTIPTMRVPEQERITRTGLRKKEKKITINKQGKFK